MVHAVRRKGRESDVENGKGVGISHSIIPHMYKLL